MRHQSTEIHVGRKDKSDFVETSRRDVSPLRPQRAGPYQEDRKENLKSILCRESKGALVQPGVTNNLPADTGAQNGFEHVLLEPSNDGVTLQHVQDRGVTLQDVRTTIFVVVDEFRHIAFAISHMGKPFRTVGDGISLRLGFQSRGLLFESVIKQLLRRVRPVDLLSRLQQIQRKLMTLGLKKI